MIKGRSDMLNLTSKLHWYCISFSYNNGNEDGECCTYNGYTRKDHFPKAAINEAKEQAHPGCYPNRMVLIGITYLGYMTQKEFNP